jgi:hypothetical protein
MTEAQKRTGLTAGGGMILGAALGTCFGIVFGHMVLGMIFGPAFGLVFGAAVAHRRSRTSSPPARS